MWESALSIFYKSKHLFVVELAYTCAVSCWIINYSQGTYSTIIWMEIVGSRPTKESSCYGFSEKYISRFWTPTIYNDDCNRAKTNSIDLVCSEKQNIL